MNPNTNEKSNKIEICDVIVRYINTKFCDAYEEMKSCHLLQIDFPPYRLNRINWKSKTEKRIKSILENKINPEDNVYFIFCEHKKLLYVGKYKTDIKKRLHQRLHQHLIDRQSINSKLPQIQDYVLGNKNRCNSCEYKCKGSKDAVCRNCYNNFRKHNTIFVGTLRVDPPEYAQLAETYYIKEKEYKPKWNQRID